ncbi:MAG: NUDIX hydrolase [Candidatus Woesearchaeota archaeon]
MIFVKRPSDFHGKHRIVSCLLENNGEILLLLRQDNKPQGNTWCVVGGKVDDGEDIWQAITREIGQETNIFLEKRMLKYVREVYVRYADFDFIYHMFKADLKTRPKVVLNNAEHRDFVWVSPEASLKMPLIQDQDACIKLVYSL